MQAGFSFITRWGSVVLWMLCLFCIFYFHIFQYFNLDFLKQSYSFLQTAVAQHYWICVVSYIVIAISLTALALPVTGLIAIAGGMFFGLAAIFYVLISLTVGAVITFFMVQHAAGDWLVKKIHHKAAKLQQHIESRAFTYLLCLRLVPILPFSTINIAAGLFAVRFRVFVTTTFVGMMPMKMLNIAVGYYLS